jgi:hypothetical protein
MYFTDLIFIFLFMIDNNIKTRKSSEAMNPEWGGRDKKIKRNKLHFKQNYEI